MDPLTALSLAGNIIQFVDFSTKLISAIHQIHTSGQLDVLAGVASTANNLLDYATKLRRPLHAPGVSGCLTEDEIVLERICQECSELAEHLISRLTKLQRSEKRNIWRSFGMALLSYWSKEDWAAMVERLAEYRREIDSRVLRSLRQVQRVDFISVQQSERFDRLGDANRQIVTALINHNASENRGLQAQLSALSLLLDRAETIIASQDNTHRVIIDVFGELSHNEETEGENNANSVVNRVRWKEREIRKAVQAKILESLYFSSITERFEAVDEAHKKTFQWIFQHPEDTTQFAEGRHWDDFPRWLESGKGIYWINGKAASGKSTLMKYISNHSNTNRFLSRWAGESKLCSAGFFFWNGGTKQQRSQSGLFRSLLYDILYKYPEFIPIVLPAQWAARYSAECLSSLGSPTEPWLLSTLQLAFKTLISQTTLPLKLCIFIDGLDEYEGEDIDIAETFGNVSMSENVKICCSSRPHQVFQDAFAAGPGLRLQDLTILDIRQYIFDKLERNTRMQQLADEEPLAIKGLIAEIEAAASGVFLWVRLVVASLLNGLGHHDDILYLQKRLRQLPKELDDLYHYMVFKVDKVYQEETSQLFQLIDSATRERDSSLELRETSPLSVLLFSFASEKDTKLALTARGNFLTNKDALNRCKKMEIVLRTRCGGLLEVQHGKLNPSQAAVSPEMKIGYLHRTVKDFLETRNSRAELSDRTGSNTRNGFHPTQAIFRAHILALKAVNVVGEWRGWALIEEGLTWACRAELETATGQPEYLDEFYKTASQSWSGPSWRFFEMQKSMLSLASQIGLYHYLDEKLSEDNVLAHEDIKQRPLLDYALVPDKESEQLVSHEVIVTLLKYGANPNRLGPSGWTPWQNALSYVNVVVAEMQPEERKQRSRAQWTPIIQLLLESGADFHARCLGPTRYVHTKHETAISDQLWTIDQVISRIRRPDSQSDQLSELLIQIRKPVQLSQRQKKNQHKSCRTQ